MAIKKRIETAELKRNKFISKGAHIPSEQKGFKNVLVRFPIEVLNDLDALLENQLWMSRNTWIMQAISEKLTTEMKNVIHDS